MTTPTSSPITNVMVVGIGGQGVLTATEILAEAAIAVGHDVKKTEVAGMAQRGGVVTSHLRFGPKVLAPAIPPGQVDIMIGFEAAEGLRWVHQLRAGGVAVFNTLQVVPPIVSSGLAVYPADPLAEIDRADIAFTVVDGMAIARALGNLRLINTIMLGAACDALPFPAEVLQACVLDRFARKPEVLDLNRRAFEMGRAAGAAA